MPASQRVVVVGLGDLGRSPRMQYHALALADAVGAVDLVAYAATESCSALRDHPRIRLHRLASWSSQAPRRLPRAWFLGDAVLRVIHQAVSLLWMLLWRVETPHLILVQSPPAIPTLLVAWIAARSRAAKLVIDWHNYGYAMLALKVGPAHPAVRLAQSYERALGRRADAHLCVSRAMQQELAEQWGIDAVVLYDRPAARFAPLPAPQRAQVLSRFRGQLGFSGLGNPAVPQPAVVVSPTSWTPDEDFPLLLEAAAHCDELLRQRDAEGRGPAPHLLIVLTGQGPLRAHYERAIARLALRKVHLRTAWFSADDYPLLVGAADLGLCLHRSASGVDLPMKVADMLGAGLPVCALDYGPCLAERVRHGENGMTFSTSTQLAEQLCELFRGFPHETALLERLRRNVAQQRQPCWADGWKLEAQPLLSQLLSC